MAQRLFSNDFFLARAQPDENAAYQDVIDGRLVGYLDVQETVAVKSRRDGREHNPRLGYVPDNNVEALYRGHRVSSLCPSHHNTEHNVLVDGGLQRGPGGALRTSIVSLVSHKENVHSHDRRDAIIISPEPKIAVIVRNTGNRLGYMPHETAQIYSPFLQHPFIAQNCDIVVEFNAIEVNRFRVTIMGKEEDYHQVRQMLPQAEDWTDHIRTDADAGNDTDESE